MTSAPAITAQPPLFSLPGSINSIAVLRALYLGDLLCALPALRALRGTFPAARITLIGLPWATDLATRLPWIDDVVAFPGYPGLPELPYEAGATAEFLAATRAAGYDLAIQLHGDGRVSNSCVADLGARLTLGYRRAPDTRLTLSLPYRDDEHEVRRWLRLVAAIGAGPDDMRLVFPYSRSEGQRAAAMLRTAPDRAGPLVGLHPGAKAVARRWPPARFAELADALVEQSRARIVLTGSNAECATTAAVRAAMRAPALDLAGATDLGTFAALVAQLDLLVTNDTGASHLASATGTRSVVLFGPTRPAQWAPLDSDRHVAVDALANATDSDGASALQQLAAAAVLKPCLRLLAAANRFSAASAVELHERAVGAEEEPCAD